MSKYFFGILLLLPLLFGCSQKIVSIDETTLALIEDAADRAEKSAILADGYAMLASHSARKAEAVLHKLGDCTCSDCDCEGCE